MIIRSATEAPNEVSKPISLTESLFLSNSLFISFYVFHLSLFQGNSSPCCLLGIFCKTLILYFHCSFLSPQSKNWLQFASVFSFISSRMFHPSITSHSLATSSYLKINFFLCSLVCFYIEPNFFALSQISLNLNPFLYLLSSLSKIHFYSPLSLSNSLSVYVIVL